MPVVLALVIDTSSAAVTAAVVAFDLAAGGREPVVLAARTTIDARAHAELLTPSIAACLDQADLTPRDLGAVIAGVGPGPFTGLRVGLVTALAVADARSLPAYGVCSLDAIAAEAGFDGPLLVAGDARRREVYWARYSAGFPATGARRSGPDVGRAADLALDDINRTDTDRTDSDRTDTDRTDTDRTDSDRSGGEAMTGAGARLYAEVLGRPLLDIDYPTPLGLARLAADRVCSAAPGEPLTPLYLRRPDAVAATAFKSVTQ